MRPASPRNLTKQLEDFLEELHPECSDDIKMIRACIFELESLRRANAELIVELHMRDLEEADQGDEIFLH